MKFAHVLNYNADIYLIFLLNKMSESSILLPCSLLSVQPEPDKAHASVPTYPKPLNKKTHLEA